MLPGGQGLSTINACAVFNTITGDFPATGGRIHFFGEDVTELPPYERIRKGLRRTYQSSQLFRDLSVRDASAARVILLTWMGPLSSTSTTGFAVRPGHQGRPDRRGGAVQCEADRNADPVDRGELLGTHLLPMNDAESDTAVDKDPEESDHQQDDRKQPQLLR